MKLDPGMHIGMHLVSFEEMGVTTAYPEYSTREVMTTGQLLCCEVKVKIPVCPTVDGENPST
jgi:hypothetical protein